MRIAIGSAGGAAALSFRDYLLTRKYDFGRGSEAAWCFIALARGDRSLPDIGDRQALDDYLSCSRASADIRAGAHSAWRSFIAYRSRVRRAERVDPVKSLWQSPAGSVVAGSSQ